MNILEKIPLCSVVKEGTTEPKAVCFYQGPGAISGLPIGQSFSHQLHRITMQIKREMLEASAIDQIDTKENGQFRHPSCITKW